MNSDYHELINFFGAEKLKDRFKFLFDSAHYLLKRYEKDREDLSDYFSVNEFLLNEIIVDYFSDIKRLNDFHSIEKSQPEKVAAYTAYWVWRRKPIQVTGAFTDKMVAEYPYLKWINDIFASSLLISMVYDTSSYREGEDIDYNRYNYFQRLLSYFFSYRAVNPQALELVVYALSVNPIYARRIC